MDLIIILRHFDILRASFYCSHFVVWVFFVIFLGGGSFLESFFGEGCHRHFTEGLILIVIMLGAIILSEVCQCNKFPY